jgi:hypothetical protein
MPLLKPFPETFKESRRLKNRMVTSGAGLLTLGRPQQQFIRIIRKLTQIRKKSNKKKQQNKLKVHSKVSQKQNKIAMLKAPNWLQLTKKKTKISPT